MKPVDFRDLFPVTANLIYLNHAAVGPLSRPAYEAMERHARDQLEFGALHWRDWYAEHTAARAAAARLIGAADPSEVAILKNTSEGLSFVAEGYRWRTGENVVTTAFEFLSNFTPWKRLERRGVECRVAASLDTDEIERLIDDRTRIVTVSSVAFHNGAAADLDALGDLCRRRGALFCVDAIQSVGALPIDVRRSGISFLAADGHKWMCAPEGAAIFYVAAEHRERLDVLETGWTNVERRGRFIGTTAELLPDARRFEAGSLNTNGIYGLRAAIELLLRVGVAEIGTRVIALASRLAEGLESIGLVLGAPRPVRSGIVGATPRNVEPADLRRLHAALEKERIICAPREGLLRFSPHFYNDEEEMDRVVETLRGLTR